ncbi:hypothetical protein K438DRAFT_1936000 [Mycena galopus ATCC 62051]|nr:hypothetical protein K438DRAFT_1936000 [Mycena galopus ATCC 62051]
MQTGCPSSRSSSRVSRIREDPASYSRNESESYSSVDVVDLQAQAAQLSEFPNQTSRIPEETLLVIFRHALPPSWGVTYGTTLPPFPQTGWSADFNTKLSIVRVCKIWHRIGLEFLYESVVLNCIGQLPALVYALETGADAGIGAFVRRLEIGYWVPHTYHALHKAELKKIFELCPRLHHFAFNPQLLPLGSLPTFPEVSTLRIGALAYLEVSDCVKYAVILPALAELCHTLQSLSLLLPTDYGAIHPILTFERLESLRLRVATESILPEALWMIPHLQQLLIHPAPNCDVAGTTNPMTDDDVYLVPVHAFLDAYGRTLRVLSVRLGPGSSLRTDIGFEQFLDLCPALQHLCVTNRSRVSASSPKQGILRSVDVLTDFDFMSSQVQAMGQELKKRYPALRSCRYIDSVLDLFPQLPPLIGPGAGSDPDCPFPVSSHLEFLSSQDPDYIPHEGSDPDSDLERFLEEGGEEEDSGGSEGSDTDSSDLDWESSDSNSTDYHNLEHIEDTARTTSDDEDWEVDRDEAIAIFRRTLIR